MRIALYARVSTRDKEQNLDTQLYPLRDFCHANQWADVAEYVDQASATDFKRRTAWHGLLEDARMRKIDLIIVWRMDRAFRSVLHAAQTLENLKRWNVGLKSYQEAWLDTTSPMGEMMYYITIAYAQLEKSLIAERVKAGMDRAKKEGKSIGRPRVTDDPKREKKLTQAVNAVQTGQLSYRKAAKKAGVGLGTLQRALKASGYHTDQTH